MQTEIKKISVARDFSPTPYGRYRTDGIESGQVFREEHLLPAIEKGAVEIDIDGVDGLPSSFWEEAIGGAIRAGIKHEELKKKLTIVCSEPELQTFVRSGWRFAEEAASKFEKN